MVETLENGVEICMPVLSEEEIRKLNDELTAKCLKLSQEADREERQAEAEMWKNAYRPYRTN